MSSSERSSRRGQPTVHGAASSHRLTALRYAIACYSRTRRGDGARVAAALARACRPASSRSGCCSARPAARHVVAAPRADRWHTRSTPLARRHRHLRRTRSRRRRSRSRPARSRRRASSAASSAAARSSSSPASSTTSSHLPPLAKLAAQVARPRRSCSSPASASRSSRTTSSPTAIGVVWLVGMTNAFNLLDNMDGLAATLAAIACAFFAIDAFTVHPSHLRRALSLALCFACLGFLPYNLRLRRPGRRLHGRHRQPGARLRARRARPRVELEGRGLDGRDAAPADARARGPDPRHDARHGRAPARGPPGHQGGRDHTSHRLVYHGLSDKRAVVLLGVVSAALGCTSLALQGARRHARHARRRAPHVRVARPVRQLPRRRRTATPSAGRRVVVRPLALRAPAAARRGARRLRADHRLVRRRVLIRVQGTGTIWDRHVFHVSLPVDARRALRRVHRASGSTAASGATRARATRRASSPRSCVSEATAVRASSGRPSRGTTSRAASSSSTRSSASLLIGASRFWERGARTRDVGSFVGRDEQRPHADRRRRPQRPQPAARAARDAGRARRRLRRRRPALRRRRIQGVPVVGGARRDRLDARAARSRTPCS